jgi:hypothetical protein
MKAAEEEDLNQRSRGVYLDRNMRHPVATPRRVIARSNRPRNATA